MPQKKSAKAFLQRARAKGSDLNKDIVDGKEVLKHLEPKTLQSYARSLDLWKE